MELRHLIRDLELEKKPDKIINNMEVKGITDASSNVQEDFLFVAIKGYHVDGHNYIEEVINLGASVVVGEEDRHDLPIPYLKVENSRKALGVLAKNYYGNPSKNKIMIGITGTNGKTTTSYLLKHILEENGLSCSLIGTNHNIINGEVVPTLHTTPNTLFLNELLVKSNDQAVIMEASSHGLAQHRLEGVEFDFGLFTNLTHDHLDYHGSIEKYFHAKKTLFEKMKTDGKAIVNADDFWGEKLITLLQKEGTKVYSIGHSNKNDLYILDIDAVKTPSIKVREKYETCTINLPMAGLHNLYNSVMAYATAKQVFISTERVLQSIQRFPGVPGRFELIKQKNGSTVVVDYAHTADALFHCLQTAKDAGAKRIIHVFGFRGNRDATKREEMIKITSELSDQYILTMDDLNSVPFEEMLEIFKSLNNNVGNDKGMVIPDRTLAIKQALAHSERGDWVLITGKGHEKYQRNFTLPTETDKETVMYINCQ